MGSPSIISGILGWFTTGLPELVQYSVAFIFEGLRSHFTTQWLVDLIPPDVAADFLNGDLLGWMVDIPLIGPGLAFANWCLPFEPVIALWASAYTVAAFIRVVRHGLGAIPFVNLG